MFKVTGIIIHDYLRGLIVNVHDLTNVRNIMQKKNTPKKYLKNNMTSSN